MPKPEDRVDGGITDRLEFEPVERSRPSRKWGRIVAFLVLVGVGSGGAWVLWGKSFLDAGQQGDLPVIRADATPIKIKPADPGGMDVPDRDKLVYNRLNGEGAGDAVERLLPPPEEPLPVPETGKTADTEPVEESSSMDAISEASDAGAPVALEPVAPQAAGRVATAMPEPPEPPSETAQVSSLDTGSEPPNAPQPATQPPTETAAISTMAELQPEPEPLPAPEPIPAAQPEPAAPETALLPTADTYRIQLAALRSQDRAEAEWKRLRSAHTDLLGRLGLSIVRVDLGADKGVFYRLRAGPLVDAATAKSLCERLSARNVGCLVVRPGT